MIFSMNEITWQEKLNKLFIIDQKERKDYDDFLNKKGHIKGTFIKNWHTLAKEYQNSKGLDYIPGDRIFGNDLRDTEIENLVLKYANDAIVEPEYRNKMFTLVKHADNNLNLQIFFLSKLKNNIYCRDIAKYLEERIKSNSNQQKMFSAS